LTIGTHVQAYNALLAAIAALTPTDGNIIVGDGTTFVTESGATARASLGARTVTAGTGVAVEEIDPGNTVVVSAVGPPVVAHTTSGDLSNADKGKFHTNEGASALVTLTLPSAVAGGSMEFYVHNINGIRVQAATGDTIRLLIAGNITPAGGYVESIVVGDYLRLVAINATEWIACIDYNNWTAST
jgi:hypothetical protein